MSPFCRQRRKWNMTVPNSAMRGSQLRIFRAIWEMVSCLIAVQAKASGYEFHQIVLTKLCGNLHATRSDRAVTCNLRRRHGYAMSNDHPKGESMSLEEATTSNM